MGGGGGGSNELLDSMGGWVTYLLVDGQRNDACVSLGPQLDERSFSCWEGGRVGGWVVGLSLNELLGRRVGGMDGGGRGGLNELLERRVGGRERAYPWHWDRGGPDDRG